MKHFVSLITWVTCLIWAWCVPNRLVGQETHEMTYLNFLKQNNLPLDKGEWSHFLKKNYHQINGVFGEKECIMLHEYIDGIITKDSIESFLLTTKNPEELEKIRKHWYRIMLPNFSRMRADIERIRVEINRRIESEDASYKKMREYIQKNPYDYYHHKDNQMIISFFSNSTSAQMEKVLGSKYEKIKNRFMKWGDLNPKKALSIIDYYESEWKILKDELNKFLSTNDEITFIEIFITGRRIPENVKQICESLDFMVNDRDGILYKYPYTEKLIGLKFEYLGKPEWEEKYEFFYEGRHSNDELEFSKMYPGYVLYKTDIDNGLLDMQKNLLAARLRSIYDKDSYWKKLKPLILQEKLKNETPTVRNYVNKLENGALVWELPELIKPGDMGGKEAWYRIVTFPKREEQLSVLLKDRKITTEQYQAEIKKMNAQLQKIRAEEQAKIPQKNAEIKEQLQGIDKTAHAKAVEILKQTEKYEKIYDYEAERIGSSVYMLDNDTYKIKITFKYDKNKDKLDYTLELLELKK